ncbi:Uncharacterized membrane protein [Rhizobiales bacterium GAS191]|jgi:uncharacterized membrane protein|nr:Uncharacterized membrane protein [Rhizobiales bacterium GAS113]SEC29890.1 Uncharacterized membrane protein [Rhizobiales bacterium GAS188]SEC96285.1 Uncharacterized membrane protein [Rhizobiales bacterium GAS191]
MEKDRLLAFTDGVVAIIITIMVLELKVPAGHDFVDLIPTIPIFLSYALSFIYVGIYWNNHHHFFQLVTRVDGTVLWANLHLLFWISLIPFATAWTGENHFAPAPTAVYGLSLLMPALAWYVMKLAIIRVEGHSSAFAQMVGRDFKGMVSPILYVAGIGLAFVSPWIANAMYFLVAMMWLIPERRVERLVKMSD